MGSLDMAALRRMVTAIEGNDPQGGFAADGENGGRSRSFTLGHEGADQAFPHGLAGNALHEIVAENPGATMAASGFSLALSCRMATRKRPIVWIEEERAAAEYGGIYPPGLAAFGIDPTALLIVRCPDARQVLKAANDALEAGNGKAHLSAVVTSITGQPQCLDLTASRRLLLAAEASGLTVLLLKSHPSGQSSAAVSRWRIAAAPSRSAGANAPGNPTFSAVLERNRHGTCGQWIMEWNNDRLEFGPSGATQDNAGTRISRNLVPVSANGPALSQRPT
ncbi:hypothetical protein AAIB41_10325 [Brucella sp. BE17]|uniref:ImuA family protein n=1 Tax=Brucella sp. BE17 TaxID=3142977 RepID=UPI0031BAD59F